MNYYVKIGEEGGRLLIYYGQSYRYTKGRKGGQNLSKISDEVWVRSLMIKLVNVDSFGHCHRVTARKSRQRRCQMLFISTTFGTPGRLKLKAVQLGAWLCLPLMRTKRPSMVVWTLHRHPLVSLSRQAQFNFSRY